MEDMYAKITGPEGHYIIGARVEVVGAWRLGWGGFVDRWHVGSLGFLHYPRVWTVLYLYLYLFGGRWRVGSLGFLHSSRGVDSICICVCISNCICICICIFCRWRVGSLWFLHSSRGVDSPAPETEELRTASSILTQLQSLLESHSSAKLSGNLWKLHTFIFFSGELVKRGRAYGQGG